jgi:hypothetical protein
MRLTTGPSAHAAATPPPPLPPTAAARRGPPPPRAAAAGGAPEPASAAVFKEAQENILRLNASRVRALTELKAAQERIADLEARLADAERRAAGPAAPPLRGAATANPAAAAVAATTTTGVFLAYETSWPEVYLLHSADGGAWSPAPGARLSRGEGPHAGRRVIALPAAARVEFVLTDGGGKFDSPNPYGEPGRPKNYVAKAGSYFLRSGRLERLEE